MGHIVTRGPMHPYMYSNLQLLSVGVQLMHCVKKTEELGGILKLVQICSSLTKNRMSYVLAV